MSTSSRRAARRWLQAAHAFGVERVHRRRGESAPDLPRVVLPSGVALVVEVKTRARLPHLATAALEQAARYDAGAVPVAVVSQLGGRALVWLALEDLARLVGLPSVPRERPQNRKRRAARQLELPTGAP